MAADTPVGLDAGPELSADAAPTPPVRPHSRLRTVGWYVLLVALSGLVLFPIYATLVRAVSNPIEYFQAGAPLRPLSPQWDAFGRAFTEGNFARAMTVSLVVTVLITAGQVVTSILAAYAFAFLRFPFKRLAFALFMATLMLPIEVTLIPNLQTVRNWGWFNTYQGLAAPFMAAGLGTFLIRQGFLGVPDELRDAARLDGFGHLRFLTRVAVPLARPVIAAFTVISFLAAWNQYLWPQGVTTQQDWQTAQIRLATFGTSNVDKLNLGVAAAIVVAIPILVLLLVFQRQIVRGLTAGAVKG